MIKIPDFELVERVPQEIIDRYKDKVPEQMVEFWKTYGFGSFQRGYLKSINPDEWIDVLQEISNHFRDGVPLFATAMGDFIVWDGKSVQDFKVCYDDIDIISSGMKFFFGDLYDEDDYTMKNDFKWDPYIEALEKYGSVSYNECFGYTPLLALGGSEKVENLEKVKLREYILLNVSVTGIIY